MVYTNSRFRLPMEPILLLFASHATFWNIILLQEIKTLLALGVLLAILSLGTNFSDKDIEIHREVAMPNAVRLAQGTRLLKAGQVS